MSDDLTTPSSEQRTKRQLNRARSQVTALKKLLRDARPGLAIYARQVNDPFWTTVLADVDSALGNAPAFRPNNRSA